MHALVRANSTTCASACDCAFNGDCVSGTCSCHAGWTGVRCGSVTWEPGSARRAFNSSAYTWGGSILRGPDGLIHMFASELTGGCGIMHYCSNSRVIHLTASSPLGPYERVGVALAPRAWNKSVSTPPWDSGAIHGPSIHRVPDSACVSPPCGFALYYMGTRNTWSEDGRHPDCSEKVDPQQGDRATRRIGIATSASLFGPWARRERPLFGPADPSSGAWDTSDVSNPTPILMANGSCVLLYKGRGGRLQAMGAATAARFDGPFTRSSPRRPVLGPEVEDTWGWVQPASRPTGGREVLHVVSHVGNGARAAGGHAWSLDGVAWHDTTDVSGGGEPAYTGRVAWGDGRPPTTLARRERPQALLRAGSGGGGNYSYGVPEVICTSAEEELCREDGGPGAKEACRSYTMCEAVRVQ